MSSAAEVCLLDPYFQAHVEVRLEKAWEAGLLGDCSELWSEQMLDPAKLCGLLLRTGVGMEGLEAVAATVFRTTEAYRSWAELERKFKLPDAISQLAFSGAVCGLKPPPRRIRTLGAGAAEVSSLTYVRMLDGTVQCSLFRDPCPSTSAKMQAVEGLLGSMRRIAWGPEHHAIFPWWFQRRLYFLAWVGEQLGLQPTWTGHVLPFLSVVDAVEPLPKTGK